MGRKTTLPPVDAHPARIAEGFFPRRKESGGAPAGSEAPDAAVAEQPASESRATGSTSNGKRTRDAP